MDTQMVDQEPYRSVQLIRRIDSRIPSPLLSTTASSVAASTGSSGLGRLADLRSPAPAQSIKPTTTPPVWGRTATSSGTPGPSTQPKTRGWTSVVNQRSTPKPDANPTAWLTDRSISSVSGPAASASTSRAGSSASLNLPPTTSQAPEDVPDDWEDDT